MNGFGAKIYQRVGVDSSVVGADPHQLVLMLFDGALEAIRHARSHMAAKRIADKGMALGKAISIVQDGLRASVDVSSGGQLAERLTSLYDYILMRLLQANLRNDANALDEVTKLLGDLRGAWAAIQNNAGGEARLAARTNGAQAYGTEAGPRLTVTA